MITNEQILESLHALHQKVHAMSTTVAEIQAALTQATADITTLLTDVAADIAALNTTITGLQGASAPDLAPALAQVQALDATVQAAITTFAPPAPSA